MVVSIFLDPVNPKDSTRELLNSLENGDFGPFYGRIPGDFSVGATGPTRIGPSKTAYNTPGYYRSP